MLDEFTGIDILGNILESTKLSINPKLYGNLHGFGHEMIAYIHDPDGRHLEEFSAMGSVTTAMRDPGTEKRFCLLKKYFELDLSVLPLAWLHQLDDGALQGLAAEISSSSTWIRRYQRRRCHDADQQAKNGSKPAGDLLAEVANRFGGRRRFRERRKVLRLVPASSTRAVCIHHSGDKFQSLCTARNLPHLPRAENRREWKTADFRTATRHDDRDG